MENKQSDEIRRYSRLVERLTPNSALGKGCLRAFWVGGAICVLGQLIALAADKVLRMPAGTAGLLAPTVLVFLGSALTGLGVYDDIGRYAGAGSIVPITGFANSVTAPAMEFRREGLVLGVGAKLFALAGPVLAYGIASSTLVGLCYYISGRCAA